MDTSVTFDITRDDGRRFVIDGWIWKIPSDGLDGWHSVTTSISSLENVGRPGSIITAERVGAVERTITAELADSKMNAAARGEVESFFVPGIGYTVDVTYMGRKRRCTGIQSKLSMSEGNVFKRLTFVWTIYCPFPYMEDAEKIESSGTDNIVDGRISFPYLSLDHSGRPPGFSKGFVTGVYRDIEMSGYTEGSSFAYVENVGDLPSTFDAEVTIPRQSGTGTLKVYVSVMEDIHGNGVYQMTDRELTFHSYVNFGTVGADTVSFMFDLGKRPFEVENVFHDDVNPGKVYIDEHTLLLDPYVGAGKSVVLNALCTFDQEVVDSGLTAGIRGRYTGI